MARVTALEVLEIISTSRQNLNPFIGIANSLITETLSGEGFSDLKLKNIELWLSAFFITQSDRIIVSEKITDVNVTYSSLSGEGLKSNNYGQTVLILDTSGKLLQTLSTQSQGFLQCLSSPN